MKQLVEDFSVAPQIQPGDMPAIAARGIRGIIVNRPDGEEPGQPTMAEVAAAAQDEGIAVHFVPIVANSIFASDVEAFREAVDKVEGPVLAYCRTGTRSTILWAMANPSRLPVDERMRIAAAAGYDLRPFRDRL